MGANDLATFWVLFGKYGLTMTLNQMHTELFPSTTKKDHTQQARRRAAVAQDRIGIRRP